MVEKMLTRMKEQEPGISLEGASGCETRRQAAEGENCMKSGGESVWWLN